MSRTSRPSSVEAALSWTLAAQRLAAVSMASRIMRTRCRDRELCRKPRQIGSLRCERTPRPRLSLVLILPRLQLQPPRVQDRLGVAGGLGAALEDEVAGSLEGDGIVEIRRHRPVMRIARVLAVDDR